MAQADRDVGVCNSLGPMIGSTEAEEDATSRLIVNNDASEATRSVVVPDGDPVLTFVRLATEAGAEYTRLTHQRRFAPRASRFRGRSVGLVFGPPLNSDGAAEPATPSGVFLAFTRRRALLRAIGNRALVLVQTVCEDACGRRVAAHLTGITVPLRTAPADVESYETLVHGLPLEILDPSLREWEARTLSVHHDFWLRRLTRDRTITRQLVHGKTDLFQPGLFDRRADRAHGAIAADQRDLRADLRASVRVAESAVNVTIRRAQLVLVLVPGGRPCGVSA
jgi:hypothetical protein